MLRVLIVSQYSLPEWKRNMNAYQRVFYGAEHADIDLVLRKHSQVSSEILSRVSVHWAPVDNRWLFLIYVFFYAAWLRLRRGLDYVITEPSGFAILGFALKYTTATRWALDVWDRPRWRPGTHEEPPSRWSDRLIFRLMKCADVYILSVLPRAARDIDPSEHQTILEMNALDLSVVSSSIPNHEPHETLHLAYGRSLFYPNMGLDVLVRAVEHSSDSGADVKVHLIGQIRADGMSLLERSPAFDRFILHGTTEASRVSLFRSVHAGLVPYGDFEDLRYIFPIKVLEHLSQGNPVIASDLPGLASMVKDGYNGLLVPPGDAEALGRAITTLWQDYELWGSLAQNALHSISRFDAEEKNSRIFLELAARRQRPAREVGA